MRRLFPWLVATVILSLPRPAAADLLVSSFSTDQVLRYDGSTGAFIDVFASGGGLGGPTFLIFTPQQPPNGVIPEPASLTLLGLGALGLLGYARRRGTV